MWRRKNTLTNWKQISKSTLYEFFKTYYQLHHGGNRRCLDIPCDTLQLQLQVIWLRITNIPDMLRNQTISLCAHEMWSNSNSLLQLRRWKKNWRRATISSFQLINQPNKWRTWLNGIGCAAHIVHNTLKFAWDIEYIVLKIYSQFYRSTVQMEALRTLCDETDGVDFINLLGYAKTWFLALGPVIGSILKLFVPLKEYFLQLRCCTTILKTFFESPFAKLWLLFIKEQVS